jgi:hypothetical protein
MDPLQLDAVPTKEFDPILEYLKEHPVPKTKFRVKVGEGRSVTYGIVGRRCLAPDLSRSSCLNVELFRLLVDFAKKYVPVPYTSIQVNQNYNCKPHRDIHNCGTSYIVAFGEYTGGRLVIEGKSFDVQYRPVLFDGSKLLHSTTPFEGNRVSIVYHTIATTPRFPFIQSITDYEFLVDGGVEKIRHIPTGGLLYKGRTPDHYLKGIRRKKHDSD